MFCNLRQDSTWWFTWGQIGSTWQTWVWLVGSVG